MKRIIFARHGETVDNARGVAQGWSDSDLSELGRSQVAKLAERLVSYSPTAIYASTLPRALTTAEVISERLALPVHELDDLRELNCGDWEGQSFAALRQSHPEVYRKWASDPTHPCPGGESLTNVLERMRRALATIGDREGDSGRPVIVSHGTAIRVIATHFLEIPLTTTRKFAQDNTAINIFDWWIDRYVLKLWNDTTHCNGTGGQ